MPSKFSCQPSRPSLSRRVQIMGCGLALAVAIPTAAALAQEPLPQTHTVRKGDTLWDLAQYYLKDPFLWPGIYRQNTDVVEDPHWIYPGEVLRIAPTDNVAAVPSMDTPVPPDSAAPDSGVATTPPAVAPDSTDALAQGPQQPSQAESQTDEMAPLFTAQRPRSVAQILRAYTDQPYRPLRRSEFYSSGFLTENQRLPFGRVLGPVTPQQIKAVNSRANALPYTTVAVEAPGGATYEVGDSLLILQLGTELDSYGNVVIPTGIGRIIESVDDHYLANIVATYGPIRNGQRVLPVESFTAGGARRAVPVSDGIRGSLIGGTGRQDLKEPQMVVFLNKGREDGVALGDLFEVRRRPQRLPDGTLRVNELMATLQVVHVRDHTATGMLLNVISPDIPPGTDVLQVAKLPS
ncbi:MAG: LysM peptidoglycan-binding domain-containing protein [Gemmatimonadales bacterium]